MKKIFQTFIAVTLVSISAASAQTNIFKTINSSEMIYGWMIVSEPSNNATVSSSAWALTNLTADFTAPNSVTLSPATSTNGLWYDPVGGGVGSIGNKTMSSWLYGQSTGLSGNLEFEGIISELTLSTNAAGRPYTVSAFVREFGGGGPLTSSILPLTSTGDFSVSFPLSGASNRTVQWGLIMQGPNIWPGDTEQLANAGSVTVVPEPTTYALLGLAAVGGLIARRLRRKA
jgi:hypothetical protein